MAEQAQQEEQSGTRQRVGVGKEEQRQARGLWSRHDGTGGNRNSSGGGWVWVLVIGPVHSLGHTWANNRQQAQQAVALSCATCEQASTSGCRHIRLPSPAAGTSGCSHPPPAGRPVVSRGRSTNTRSVASSASCHCGLHTT